MTSSVWGERQTPTVAVYGTAKPLDGIEPWDGQYPF